MLIDDTKSKAQVKPLTPVSDTERERVYQTLRYITDKINYKKIDMINEFSKQQKKEVLFEEVIHTSNTTVTSFNSNKSEWETHINNEDMLEAVKNLTKRQQNILWLIFIEGYKQREIAKALSVSEAAISKSKKLALNKLRKKLTQNVNKG